MVAEIAMHLPLYEAGSESSPKIGIEVSHQHFEANYGIGTICFIQDDERISLREAQ